MDATVVKLGGSLASSDALRPWLKALASCAGLVVVVPGGGPFADAVRAAQPRMGFDDRAAHHMALLAMEQFGRALVGRGEKLVLAGSVAAIQRAVRDGLVPIWTPTRMVLRAKDIPASWDVTSDSLAAWLAGKLRARRVLLVKHLDVPLPLTLYDLVAHGIVDPMFPHFMAAANIEPVVVTPHDLADAVDTIRDV